MLGISVGISFHSVFISLLKGIAFIKTHATGGGHVQPTGIVAFGKVRRLLCVYATNTTWMNMNVRLSERLFAIRYERAVLKELTV